MRGEARALRDDARAGNGVGRIGWAMANKMAPAAEPMPGKRTGILEADTMDEVSGQLAAVSGSRR